MSAGVGSRERSLSSLMPPAENILGLGCRLGEESEVVDDRGCAETPKIPQCGDGQTQGEVG